MEILVPLLLNIEQCNCIRVSEEEHASSCIKYFITSWSLNLLGDFIFQVLYNKLQKKYILLIKKKQEDVKHKQNKNL